MLGSIKKTPSSRDGQQGSSLLEVLISILLMSFGMLALAGMQAYSVAAQKNAANRAIASALATELAEVIRLNPTGLSGGNYDVALMTTSNPPALAPCVFPNCLTAAQLAAADLTAFQSRVRALLPQGGVELSRPGASATQANIWIIWEEAGVLDNTRNVSGVDQSAELTTDNCSANAKALVTLPRCFYMKVQL
ncbi:MAG: type IV pilus modification protein PilV [Polaromonas sp.]|nr:type IV pilus modification protein PilV [Polaromonas sp.]